MFGRDGDARVGFEEFVAARQSALLRTAYLLTGHHQDAEDLVQMALIKAVPHWAKIADDPEPYVRTILVRENISRWRRRRWREIPAQSPELALVPQLALISEPAQGSDLDLLRVLADLAPRQRAVIVLRYYEDLTEAQTADLLGIRVGTVKSHTRDALARLRSLLGEPDGIA